LTDTKSKSPFRAIFPATITPKTIEHLEVDNAKRTKYVRMTDATFKPEKTDGKEAQPESIRTAMAFGRSVDMIDGMLAEGRPVLLACQYDGGSVRVIGPWIEKARKAV
jgi:hypothetical protein